MSVMTATRTTLDLLPEDRPLTVEDLGVLPADGRKYELDDGVLVVSPAPANNHHLVVSRLHIVLAVACPPEFLVLTGPGVEMSKIQYRIPDLVVLPIAAFDIEGKSVQTAPELAIEVASPSTAVYDRNRKTQVYAGFGIASYWIVTPSIDEPRLTAFELRRGAYRQVADVSADEAFRTRRPFPAEIVPSALVAGPWRQ